MLRWLLTPIIRPRSLPRLALPALATLAIFRRQILTMADTTAVAPNSNAKSDEEWRAQLSPQQVGSINSASPGISQKYGV